MGQATGQFGVAKSSFRFLPNTHTLETNENLGKRLRISRKLVSRVYLVESGNGTTVSGNGYGNEVFRIGNERGVFVSGSFPGRFSLFHEATWLVLASAFFDEFFVLQPFGRL
jgi:hypothetical protein